MTDEEALKEIDRQEKRFAAAKCGRGLQLGDGLVVRPLAPALWDWWRVDGIHYHGKPLTILFDRDGTRYGRGKGLRAFLDGDHVRLGLVRDAEGPHLRVVLLLAVENRQACAWQGSVVQ